MGRVVVGRGTVSMLIGSAWVGLGAAKDLNVVVIDDVEPDMDPLEFNCIQPVAAIEPGPFARAENPHRGKRKARHRGVERW